MNNIWERGSFVKVFPTTQENDDEIQTDILIPSGIPQGSYVGPTLFILYVQGMFM